MLFISAMVLKTLHFWSTSTTMGKVIMVFLEECVQRLSCSTFVDTDTIKP